MNPIWTADFEPDETLIRDLLATQFPELTIGSMEHLGTGWDNVVYRINGDLTFRFPRRNVAAGLISNELRILPLLAPHLPAPIPLLLYAGKAEGDYPYPFAGYHFLNGVTACRANLSDAQRSTLAAPLARFLRALHAIPVSDYERSWAPGDEIGRADLVLRVGKMWERLYREGVGSRFDSIDRARLLEAAQELSAARPSDRNNCWVHGDLYVRHLLVDAECRLSGVIDWGDVHLGDFALDLSIAYSFLPPEARAEFFAEYGEVDGEARKRARFRALQYGSIGLDYGFAVNDEDFVREGRFAVKSGMQSDL